MVRALLLAVAQLFSGPILGVLGAVVMLSAACFALLWLAIGYLLSHVVPDVWFASAFGGVTTLVIAWFLLPGVTGAMVGLFLERVADIVEREHYPDLPPAAGLGFGEALWASARFLAVVLGANVLLLALLFLPPAYVVLWFVVNGYLLGREYTELVLMRRNRRAEADAIRRRHRLEWLVAGAGFAATAALPLCNLVLPVVATAFMVHRTTSWQTPPSGRGARSNG